MPLKPPLQLRFGPVRLVFSRHVDAEPGGELVAFYHYKITTMEGIEVGHINFRVGETRHIRQCAGHIGYEILPWHRGHHYAYFACRAISPFVAAAYDKVVLTSEPGNMASIKTIEKLNAVFIDEIDVPRQDPSYAKGARRKRRYEWKLDFE